MADVNITNAPEGVVDNPTTQPETQEQNNETIETTDVNELAKQLADLKVELKKNKAARDKALSEVAEYKKQLRAKMSADEQAAEERKEAEEEQKKYIADLEKFKKTAEAQARYALQGMDSELAKQAADAEISGDMDALADIQKKFAQQMVKAAQADWLKSRPEINAGSNSGVKITQEEFDNMGIMERSKLYNEHPDVYKILYANSK